MSISKILADRIEKEIKNLEPSDKILIAGREYPLNIRSGNARKVDLSVGPGLPTAPQVLKAIMGMRPVKRAEMMKPEEGADHEAHSEIKELLTEIPLKEVSVYQFFDDASDMPVQVAFGTGDMRHYANVLITLGAEEDQEEKPLEEIYPDF